MSFSNGHAVLGRDVVAIPESEAVTTNGTQFIAPAALPWFLDTASDFHQQTGQAVYVTEGYRSFATQDAIFRARYKVSAFGTVSYAGKRWRKKIGQATAAVPGTSVHGLGEALDLASQIESSFTSANHKVWTGAGARRGWLNTGTNFGEPWHQEWASGRVTATIAPASSGPTITLTEEDEDMPLNDADKTWLTNMVDARVNKKIEGQLAGDGFQDALTRTLPAALQAALPKVSTVYDDANGRHKTSLADWFKDVRNRVFAK